MNRIRDPRRAWGRVDLHLHSRASNVTDYYAANLFALPESYSEPLVLYRRLKERGMSLVTLTDHNSMDGVSELLDHDLSDVFTGCELTTTFPEDGCNCHITAINFTEVQFHELDRLRGNVYEMVAYLESEAARHPIAWFVTHPLMSTQNRPYGREGGLALHHIERLMLLCPAVEVRNGARTRFLNEVTEQLVRGLDAETLMRLSERHGIVPATHSGNGGLSGEPWIKAEVGGSDDHAGLGFGETWTEFPHPADHPPTVDDLVAAIRARHTRVAGAHGGPLTLAHALFKLMYDHQARNGAGKGGQRLGTSLDLLLRFAFEPESVGFGERARMRARSTVSRDSSRQRDMGFDQVLEAQTLALVGDRSFLNRLAGLERRDDKIFNVISSLLNGLCGHYIARLQGGDSSELMRTIKELIALISSNLFVSLPYLVSYFHQNSDRLLLADCRRGFDLKYRERLVLVTDTLFEVNGVARSIQQMVVESVRRDIDLTVVACLTRDELQSCRQDPEFVAMSEAGRLHLFEAVADLGLPEYDGLRLRLPPLLEFLKYLQEQGFSKMEISTPGPVGLMGLLAAKVLQIPAASTYHTSFPEYVENYTGDKALEAVAWRYMILFYHSVDEVVVPSRFIARLLHERGLRNRKLLILDRWVDTERFHPRLRSPGFWARYQEDVDGPVVRYLYVGRVAVEKDLHLLADAYRRLHADHPEARLVIVGDGPYRRALAERLDGLPVTFTGFLVGEELGMAYASADVFVFPSTTDTWGNAPLEAQASGLPVIVTDRGGPQELMEPEHSGIRIPGHDHVALHQAMSRLLDRELRERLGRNARTFAEENRVDRPYSAILEADAYRERRRRDKQEQKGRIAVLKGLEPRSGDLTSSGDFPS